MLLALVTLLACGTPAPRTQSSQANLSTSEVAAPAPSFTNAKGELVCPVMGDVIESKKAAVGHTEHDGTTYYFCCDSCQHMFADDPVRYADGRFLAHLKAEHGGQFGNCNHVL